MRKRVGLSGLLLVLVVGSGAMAQSHSPEATPLYAPEDLAFTIPSRVGSYGLDIVEGGLEKVLAVTDDARDIWRDLLLPLGKTLSDGHIAMGRAYTPTAPDGPGRLALDIVAVRVGGVKGEDLIDTTLRMIASSHHETQSLTEEWTEVDGRWVLSVTAAEDPEPLYLYPVGEVLFLVGIKSDADLTIEDVLAELP